MPTRTSGAVAHPTLRFASPRRQARRAASRRSAETAPASGTCRARSRSSRPPNTTTATGWRISLPAGSAPPSSGSSANAAASAVVSTGVRRSRLPRSTSASPNATPFEQAEIEEMAHLEDAVAQADAGERHEADHAGERQRQARDGERRDAADQRERHADHDDERERDRAIAPDQQRENRGERQRADRGDLARRPLLRRRSFPPGCMREAGRQRHAGHRAAQRRDGRRRRRAPACWRRRRAGGGRPRARSGCGRRSRSRRR